MGCQWLAGLDGRLGMGCQWLAGLVCKVCLCVIWMGCQWLAGLVSRFVYDREEIMIGSSGVVVGTLVCGTECSGFKSRFILRFFFFLFHLSKFF